MAAATVCKLALAMGIGYYLNRKGVFTKDVNQILSSFVMNFCMPLMILTSMDGTANIDRKETWGFIVTGACFYAVMPFVSKLICMIIRVEKAERPIYELFFVFANTAFMGFPVAASVYGSGAVFYVSVFHILFNLLFFTYGVKKLNQGKTMVSEGCGPEAGRVGQAFNRESPGLIFTGGTVASIAAIIMFILDLRFPRGAADVFHFIGDITSPLSMIIIGATLGYYPLRELVSGSGKLYAVAGIRMVAIPFAVYWIMTFLGFDGVLRGVPVITLGMPVAAMVGMGCIKYGSFTKLGPQCVALTTALSLVIIPFLITILS